MSEINVLYCFDNNFWRLAAVSIRSLVRCQKNPVVVHCMVPPRTHGRRQIQKIVAEYGGRVVWRVVKVRENPYAGRDFSRWSPVIFYRLFAHRMFPHLDKILYLDSDTLVCGDVAELYNTDIKKYAMGAIRDMAVIESTTQGGKLDVEHVRMFVDKYLKHGLYVNSGVLLINVKKMPKVEARLLAVDVPLKYPDQDLLNVGLDGKIYELPLRYNREPSVVIQDGVDVDMASPVIKHFYALKPYFYMPDTKEIYSQFFKMATPLGFYPEDFARADCQRHQKRFKRGHDATTHIPHLRIDRRGRLRLFGVFRV